MLQKQKVLIPNIFQYKALQKLEEIQLNKNRGTIVMPTGTGKTFLASLWFKKQLENNPKSKLLFICHNKDILSQANEREFQNCLRDLELTYGYYNAKEKNIQQATFATVQTLVRNLDKFSKDFFDYVIVDEAHHYQAKTFKKVVKYFNPKFLLGLTATPYRMDGKDIFKVCGKVVYKAKINDAIKKGLLTKIKYYCVDNDIDFSNVKWNGSNYDEKDLNKTLCVKEYDEAIIKEYVETVKNKFGKDKTICFCATIEHCYRMQKLFNDKGFKTVALTSKNLKRSSLWVGTREKIVRDFKDGKYEIIFVRDLFNEGVDIPDANCVMMLRPTESHTIFTQQIGRGLRNLPNKDYLLILDFTGNAKRCAINFEVLGEMIELNIIKKIKNLDRKERKITIVNNGCEVRLNKRKIEVLKSPFTGGGYTKKQLINFYNDAKKQLNKIPNPTDMTELGYPSHQTYAFYFGSWSKFKQQFGDNIHNITKEQIVKQYKIFKDKYGFIPVNRYVREYNKNNSNNKLYTDNTIRNVFGSWNNFLKAMGDKSFSTYRIKKQFTKERILKDFYKLKKKLGRIPYCEEIKNKGKSNLHYNFASAIKIFFNTTSYLNFLKEIGEYEEYLKLNPHVRDQERSKEEIINKYLELKKQNKKNTSKLNYWICKCFGSFEKFKEEKRVKCFLDKVEKERKKKIKGKLIEDFNYVKNKLGRTPSIKEMEESLNYSINQYNTIFGTWGDFIKSQGLDFKPLSRRRKTRNIQEYIDEFYEVKKELGKVPTLRELLKRTKLVIGGSDVSVYKDFGKGYYSFLRKINEEHIIKKYTEKELKKIYFKKKEELGKVPSMNNFKRNFYSNLKRYGGYYKFLKRIGEDMPSRKIGKSEIENRFKKLVKRLGYIPMREQVKFKSLISKNYGSYKDFLNKVGYSIKDIKYNDKTHKNSLLTDEDMFMEYKRLKRELKRIPSCTDFCYKHKLTKFSEKLIRNRFGSWNNFLKTMDEPIFHPSTKSPSKDKIIKIYNELKKKDSSIKFQRLLRKAKTSSTSFYKKFGTWNNFLRNQGEYPSRNCTKEDIIKNYNEVKKKVGRVPFQSDLEKYGNYSRAVIPKVYGSYLNFLKEIGDLKNHSYLKNKRFNKNDLIHKYKKLKEKLNGEYISYKVFHKHTKIYQNTIETRFGTWNNFREICDNHKDNITITQAYKPKTIIIPKQKRNKKGSTKEYEWGGYSFKTEKEKIDIRKKIIEKIQDNDKVLLLESPELSAIREIEQQDKKPSKIIIPNHLEFNKIAKALQNYKTDLKIELINTSVLQYLVDSEEKFDFIWLDYCGAFSYYIKDLDVLFAKKFSNIKLVLTYNLFDPVKEDDSYYFTRVIDYVLEKVSGQNKVRLIKDISYRYKKCMYNVGFDIRNVQTNNKYKLTEVSGNSSQP